MKHLKLISRLILSVLLILVFNGCNKGKDGAPGKDGSSNVTARTFSVTSWSSNSSRYFAQLTVPELTSSNINSASVQVYYGTVANNWLAMPSTVVASTNYFWSFLTTVNLIEVRWDYNGIGIGDDPNTYYGTTMNIKVVVVPPAQLKANPNVDWKDYQEVKERFDLKD
jgi:hypothetical protein